MHKRLILVWVVTLLATPLSAQFDPELETEFDTVEAGAIASMTQTYDFFIDEEPPSTIDVVLDRGSFDFDDIEVGDVVGTMTVDLVIDNPIPFAPDITGTVSGEVEAFSVDTGELECDVIVTEIDEDLLDFMDLLGLDDPTGEVAFAMVFTDLDGDDGATIAASDEGALPLDDILLFDVPIVFELDPFYEHSPSGGTLDITTTLTSPTDDEVEIEESIELEGGAIFLRGDVDNNGSVAALLDALYLLRFGFDDGPEIQCTAAADADGNGVVSFLIDALALLNWAFNSGDEPPDPGVDECGPDPNLLECLELPDCS